MHPLQFVQSQVSTAPAFSNPVPGSGVDEGLTTTLSCSRVALVGDAQGLVVVLKYLIPRCSLPFFATVFFGWGSLYLSRRDKLPQPKKTVNKKGTLGYEIFSDNDQSSGVTNKFNK